METPVIDSHDQLRSLYMSLLTDQATFDEFKHLLSLYPATAGGDRETAEAAAVRARLNERIRAWTSAPFGGLSATQVAQWRAILVDERVNVALSPWKESNSY